MITNYENMVEAVVSALITNKKGEVLLIKSHKWGNAYLLPGGHIEKGETIFEAAKREGEEETGLKLKPTRCINVGELIYDPNFNRKAHLIYFHIVCKALTGDINLDKRELKEFIWLKPKTALKLELIEGTNQTLKNYLRGIQINITSKIFK